MTIIIFFIFMPLYPFSNMQMQGQNFFAPAFFTLLNKITKKIHDDFDIILYLYLAIKYYIRSVQNGT